MLQSLDTSATDAQAPHTHSTTPLKWTLVCPGFMVDAPETTTPAHLTVDVAPVLDAQGNVVAANAVSPVLFAAASVPYPNAANAIVDLALSAPTVDGRPADAYVFHRVGLYRAA